MLFPAAPETNITVLFPGVDPLPGTIAPLPGVGTAGGTALLPFGVGGGGLSARVIVMMGTMVLETVNGQLVITAAQLLMVINSVE